MDCDLITCPGRNWNSVQKLQYSCKWFLQYQNDNLLSAVKERKSNAPNHRDIGGKNLENFNQSAVVSTLGHTMSALNHSWIGTPNQKQALVTAFWKNEVNRWNLKGSTIRKLKEDHYCINLLILFQMKYYDNYYWRSHN